MDIASKGQKKNVLDKLDRFAHDIQSLSRNQLLSSLDAMCRNREGLEFLYQSIEKIESAGIFKETVWQHPEDLVSALVKGTLVSGYPNNVLETLSELRMLKIALGEMEHKVLSPKDALAFLEETLVHCFDLAFSDATEELRMKLTVSERQRFKLLFGYILERIPNDRIQHKILEEIEAITHQRPILTGHVRDLLQVALQHLSNTKAEPAIASQLEMYIRASSYPGIFRNVTLENYHRKVQKATDQQLYEEAQALGNSLHTTGLSCPYHALYIRFICENYPALLAPALGLSEHGKVEVQHHQKWVITHTLRLLNTGTYQFIYPLARLLNRNLLSRKPVLNALKKLQSIAVHPEIKMLVEHRDPFNSGLSARDIIVMGAIYVLGQPLGIRQGNNPTCQSARGISMWSQHSPAKFLNMLIQVTVGNALEFRFGRDLIRSSGAVFQSGLQLDLDPVSMVLVPHLDHVYNRMMQIASVTHLQEDPHVSVNPAFYGHWIQTGFASCYKQNLNAISDYETFMAFFYAAFHPNYNGGFKLIYPVPLGIIVTNSKAEFLGFHAVSLLRVKVDEDGENARIYFYNPNNEGRQNWGQGIKPSVTGHREKYGESSLPFAEFASRVYAFHYNSIEVENFLENVPASEVATTKHLAKESWGRKYVWL